MTPLAPDAARDVLAAAKADARLVHDGATVALTRRRRLRVLFTPDESYGRYHAPPAGNESLEYTYYVWTLQANADDVIGGHVARDKRGWRCVYAGEPEALALLMGTEAPDALAAGRALAARFA